MNQKIEKLNIAEMQSLRGGKMNKYLKAILGIILIIVGMAA